jgi:hypothetical protein
MVKILEDVYEMLSDPRTMYGIDMWGLDGGWKESDTINGRLVK